MLLEQFVALPAGPTSTLKPVIDLNTGRSVNQYEHPADVKERGFLRTTGDVFPHAQAQSRRLDSDHPDPYDSTGPPGQTGDHNHAPLGRRHHRAKTHLGYQVIQTRPQPLPLANPARPLATRRRVRHPSGRARRRLTLRSVETSLATAPSATHRRRGAGPGPRRR